MYETPSEISVLPSPRGPLSQGVIGVLRGDAELDGDVVEELLRIASTAAPYGDDLHLTLHTCYELHYRGVEFVDPRWEWDPDLLRVRAGLEQRFLTTLRQDVTGGVDLEGEIAALLIEPEDGIARYLAEQGEWPELREFLIHRSIYHHKEADPHAWVIPRLHGAAKAALVALEFDEFGSGHADRMHARLYADLLTGAGLNPGYLHYLDDVPAPMLALVNLMSLFGLHRDLRGALIGQLTAAEITSSPSARRMLAALRRLEADPACERFYAEHVEADAVHEQVMRREVVGNLLAAEPELTESVVFGIQASNLLEDHFNELVLHHHWRAGQSSLLPSFSSEERIGDALCPPNQRLLNTAASH
ncbi:iron-containing redox enzyme family protein [Nocardia sp. NPDC056100]|uniref:iron-containing redox enzyme family protein n=1 Tax=Nocardia sp. NPDC056100 TaxID=3345712 RepID=UPI0035DB4AB9